MPATVVIPTYNERENLAALASAILALPGDLHVIVVDDHSPDGTGELADSIARTEPRFQALHRASKLGIGTAHIAGMRRALELNLDPVVTMDADFSHHPRYIPDLLKGMERCDVMIGSRYVDGGGVRFSPLARRFLSTGANGFARWMLGMKARDCTAGFRCYRREVLESIGLDRGFTNGYSFLIEMLFLCQGRGWRIGETPIVFTDRRAGKSKISRTEIFMAAYTVLRLRLQKFKARFHG